MRHITLIGILVLLAGCETLPDVPLSKAALENNDDYPTFVPISDVTLDDAQVLEKDREAQKVLDARVARLRARATRLRNAEIE